MKSPYKYWSAYIPENRLYIVGRTAFFFPRDAIHTGGPLYYIPIIYCSRKQYWTSEMVFHSVSGHQETENSIVNRKRWVIIFLYRSVRHTSSTM